MEGFVTLQQLLFGVGIAGCAALVVGYVHLLKRFGNSYEVRHYEAKGQYCVYKNGQYISTRFKEEDAWKLIDSLKERDRKIKEQHKWKKLKRKK